jgi:phytoene synthase
LREPGRNGKIDATAQKKTSIGERLKVDDVTKIVETDPFIEVTDIVRRSGTSFYWAMRILPKYKRDAMFAVYAFCREVDDVADEPGTPDEKMRGLDAWQRAIDRLFAEGFAGDPVTRALATSVRTFDFAKADFDAVIAGMRMDAVDRLRLKDEEELALYCDRVACAVGRLSCAVFGVPPHEAVPLAKNLGDALQLTNILRDVHEDALRDHVYLPTDLLARHGCDPSDARAMLTQPGLVLACRELAEVAESRFQAAEAIIQRCDRRTIRPAAIMKAVYRDILVNLHRRGWERLSEPLSRSKLRKYGLVARALLFA